jgi:hypothetical protein
MAFTGNPIPVCKEIAITIAMTRQRYGRFPIAWPEIIELDARLGEVTTVAATLCKIVHRGAGCQNCELPQ